MVPTLARRPLFPSAHTLLSLLTSLWGTALQFLCILGNPGGGTPYQSIWKMEFRHKPGGQHLPPSAFALRNLPSHGGRLCGGRSALQ